ncbi:TetR family transcriptional regulator [Arcobacter sp. CECT 8983]|uniref:TetR/AcrR family transcriptional regulator n=1 Tax=Arcobacter sp. CECT 8983 TaxID=2044508 RepID=UPI00100B9A5A|nr:TetR/AcrR family transcriptional regulator [Arcobacter sp. CECT 8983]RXJ88761.1 TetR family transcriptional regulator [Arcobacter sp. CECT 8983]
MSPRKINKEEKRREIALASCDLIYEVGMKKLTVAEVARTAGIGKGTIYEYFENKEDIIFEIINMHIEQHHKEFTEKVSKLNTIEEKLELFFDFLLNDTEENMKHFNGYKEFLSIVLAEENLPMKEFNCEKNEYFGGELIKILEDSINKGEIKKEAINLSNGILTYQKGLAIRKMSQANFDVRTDYESFIGTILQLIEIKND